MSASSQGYQPAEIEARHYARWERAGYFAPSWRGAPYCIVIPPPNVTGTLHMGHAFQDTIMDALARYHRMRGFNTLWQPGTDHAGIATQMVVERLLNSEGASRTELGRERFVERVWAWKEQSGNTISSQLRRLAASVDWSRDCFTMDPRMSDAVTEVFVRLHDEGLIYRGKRLVNWDPVLHTALSDLEVLGEEEHGKLWHFRYPVEDSDEYVVVATTRPETMLGDTAVAVHPDDARYTHLHDRHVRLPIADRRIPVVVDEYVDPEFGTGCVKITPAHDFNDYEVGERHGLALINIFDESAKINDNAPTEYRGLDRFEARQRILDALADAGLLDRVDEHTAVIPRGDRSGAVIEPFLTNQWYVRAQPLADPAIEAVETGRTRFVPENWAKTYFEWMRNIQDWCISRQLWWGHRIPAWYDEAGNVYVARDEIEVREKHALGEEVALRRDEDVLDTWFSSALWPFTTMGWPEETDELATFYPTTVLVTGFDIIFFWVARMIMMGLKFAGDVPFREVYVTPLVRDHEGRKMSKSKGNTLDPIDFIDGIDIEGLVAKRTEGLMQPHLRRQIEDVTRKEFPEGIPAFGADALRFTFASLATMGRDVRFELPRVEGYHRFCNKLWNAAAFVLGQLEPGETGPGRPSVAERWIRSRLGAAIDDVHASFADYRFDHAAFALYEFTWHEFCDWYLEFTKPVLNDETADPEARRAVRAALADVLGTLLKLLHPIIPFVTEELWLELAPRAGIDSETIMLEAMPVREEYPEDPEAEAEIAWIKALVVGVRQIRGEMNLNARKPLPVKLAGGSGEDVARVERNDALIRQLARIESIEWLDADAFVPGAATALLGDVRILVPLEGLVDIEAEKERLGKQLGRVEADRTKAEKKLGNEKFVDNAPAEIVAKERERVAELADRAERLRAQLERLGELG